MKATIQKSQKAPSAMGSGARCSKACCGDARNTAKAIPVLMGAVQQGIEKEFTNDLLQNIQQCRSLPDHILRGIVTANKQGPHKLQDYLLKLKESIGGKCLVQMANPEDDTVIVAIDHRQDSIM